MKILMPVDGSQIGDYTIEWACRVFKDSSNEFYLLSVISEPMIAEYKLEDALQALENAKRKLEACGLRVVKSEYMIGHPVERICRYAEDEAVDQVLMGSHGRSGLTKVLLGSVSEGVLEQCKRPVFIYRHHLDALAASQL